LKGKPVDVNQLDGKVPRVIFLESSKAGNKVFWDERRCKRSLASWLPPDPIIAHELAIIGCKLFQKLMPVVSPISL
jgi:hypothetical protein